MAAHPLFAFRSKWDLTLPEASEFFNLHESTLSGYEHGKYPTPEWLMEWLENPMMSEDEIRRRIKDARLKALAAAKKRTGRGNDNPVREWRRREGMTQTQAAAALGVHTTTITAWELGDRVIPERIRRIIDES